MFLAGREDSAGTASSNGRDGIRFDGVVTQMALYGAGMRIAVGDTASGD